MVKNERKVIMFYNCPFKHVYSILSAENVEYAGFTQHTVAIAAIIAVHHSSGKPDTFLVKSPDYA